MIEFKNIKQVIEALLFASDVPLSTNRILRILDNIKSTDVIKGIEELNADYANSGRSFRVCKIGGGYQLVTKPEFARYIKRLYKGRARPRLSQAALEVLSIIAFKQPITRPEIDHIRGVSSDGVIKTLLERNLITICGRAETAGRALLYGTTEGFLRYFGINKITDLPKPKEIEELLGSGQEELEFPTDEEKKPVIEKVAELNEYENHDDQAK